MLFNLFVRKDINQGVEDWKATNGAVLLDVRTKEEYDNYHIDGSINIPMHELADIADKIPDKNTPIFVYCLSGARSADAERFLKVNGYHQASNIGGIATYRGPTV